MKSITKEKVLGLEKVSPRRICFETTHKNALRDKFLSIPFKETIKRIMQNDLGLKLSSSKNSPGRCYAKLESPDERERARAWMKKQGCRVFLRDCLDLSVALSTNLKEVGGKNDQLTEIGRLEYDAQNSLTSEEKRNHARGKLVKVAAETINDLPVYRECRFIAAVPSKNPDSDFPKNLVNDICKLNPSLENISGGFVFEKFKGSINKPFLKEKWSEWERSGLSFNSRIPGKNIILVDDFYQSGIPMQFVAQVLKDYGAREVYGLAMVKSLRNTDGQTD
jgi:hypothetical protein